MSGPSMVVLFALVAGTGTPVVKTASLGQDETDAFAIDLGAAWRLAGVNNPTIAIAREVINERLAEQLQAKSLLLPTLNAGANVRVHRGDLQRARGIILDVDSQSVYYGGGARSVAAETVAFPAIRLFSQLSDAIFEPLIARQRVVGARFDSTAKENNILLEVALRYLDLVSAQARVEAYRLTQEDFGEVARLTQAFATAGQGRQADAERARSELLHVEKLRLQSTESFGVASARLVEILHLDPATRLRLEPAELSILPLFPADASLEGLVAQALSSRPELASRTAAIAAANERLRQARYKPLLPLISVGYSGGGFAGGSNLVDSPFANNGGRNDFDVYAVWTLQNFGLGDLAGQRRRRAELGRTEAERRRTADEVRRQVIENFSDVAATRRQLEAVQRQYAAAEAGFREETNRIRGGIGLPLEILNSSSRLSTARQNRIDAVLGFNAAQFRLLVAVGGRPTEAASCFSREPASK